MLRYYLLAIALGFGLSFAYVVDAAIVGEDSICFRIGDADLSEGAPNIADMQFLTAYLFDQGPAPWCPNIADFNGDGTVNISDPTALGNWLFSTGSYFRSVDGIHISGMYAEQDPVFSWEIRCPLGAGDFD